jgi:membrane-bound lytic murein transglycosylase B
MSAKRLGRAQRATALVPLALLSAAWTASLAGVGAGSATATQAPDEQQPPARLPDGTSVPAQAIEAPASVSSADGIAPGIGAQGAAQVVSTASTAGIPSAALAAYQRAETVINAADETCNLTWQLVAAIGRVESDHGRFAGNSLDDQGVARPGIFGIALDGANQTQAIADTDAGQFDSDAQWDRAVGPMQFIPSTWSVVGVDADGDGRRDPQDIDDAALASAVYLCSGEDDLSLVAGQRSAVYRYNHSESYVDLVLSIMTAYLDGEYTSVPNGTTAAGYIQPAPSSAPSTSAVPTGPTKVETAKPTTAPTSSASSGSNGGKNGGKNTPAPSSAPTAAAPTQNPDKPKGGLGIPGAPTVTLPTLPTLGVPPVDQILTEVQAAAQCLLDGYIDNILKTDDPFDQCVDRYTS